MPETLSPERAEQVLLGKALRRLRERANLTQAQAAENADVTTQAWQRYEAGDRRLPPEKLARLLVAIGSDLEELQMERARILGAPGAPRALSSAGLSDRGAPFALPVYGRVRAGPSGPQVFDEGEPERMLEARDFFGQRSRATTQAGDSMSPWAESGAVIIYDLDRHPRRGDGCVVELEDGEKIVKLFVRNEPDAVWLEELQPKRREFSVARVQVKGVYRVRTRID